mgnify:CR=1 FL=1
MLKCNATNNTLATQQGKFMSTINIRLDDTLKNDAFAVINSYGLTPSQTIRLFLKQIADTGNIPLNFERALCYENNHDTMNAINDARKGNLDTYDSVDELLADLCD